MNDKSHRWLAASWTTDGLSRWWTAADPNMFFDGVDFVDQFLCIVEDVDADVVVDVLVRWLAARERDENEALFSVATDRGPDIEADAFAFTGETLWGGE